ncbi:response regulator [bacterium]|nr:response regulator [bacterium]MBU1958999.1 response regulator [bacterium]
MTKHIKNRTLLRNHKGSYCQYGEMALNQKTTITIVENEIYLAQSIALKLNNLGYKTEIFTSVEQAIRESEGDIFILSIDIPKQSITRLIAKFKSKIIILMTNHSNNELIYQALNSGANDYIVKPFMIDELQKKIEHYAEFYALQQSLKTYRDYHNYTLENIFIGDNIHVINPPMIVETNYIALVDKLVFTYAETKGELLTFISLTSNTWKEKVKETSDNELIYLSHFQTLTKKDTEKLFDLLKNKKFIISTTNPIESSYRTYKIETKDKGFEGNEILSIDEYIIYIVQRYQYQFPDTVLSRKLGFSRKSLHERRKKYNVYKSKN